MPEQTNRNCYRCGKLLPIAEMNAVVSTTISHQVDPALTADFFCPACFSVVRSTPESHTLRRVFQRHDLIQYVSVETLNRTLHQEPSERRRMRELPPGLRCVDEDFDRIHELRGDYSAEGPLQSDEDALAACFRVIRNRNQCPYFIPETRSLVDYPELRTRLERLEVR